MQSMSSMLPPVLGGAPVLTPHTRGFITLLVAAVTYLNYPTVDPRGRVTLIPESQILPSYDFIIVGAGSAGCVVASRLTENSNWTVLLLEAGGDETAQTDVPLLTRDLYGTPFDWNYTTVPQASACRATNGVCSWPRGRALGGTSVLSDNMYVRGNRMDYDRWAARGNPGWSYNEVLPYFRLSEDNETPEYRADTKYHGSGGYLTVGVSAYLTPMADILLEASQQMGYPTIDFNAATQTGFMIAEATIRNGTRCSTAKAFLRPARNRPNLNVSYYSVVTRVMIGEVNKTAYGVQFFRNGTFYSVFASKEVIVCAGSTASPQILLLSGVGPTQELKKFNLPVYANLPVGQNLLDHSAVPLFYIVNQSYTITRELYENGEAIFNYAMELPSTLGSPLATENMGFVNSPYANTSIDYPDIEIITATSVPNHYNELQLFYSAVVSLQPLSTGNITLASPNPFDRPVINPNYYAVPPDFQRQVTAAKIAFNFTQTPALQALNTTLFFPLYSLCNNITHFSEEFWECLVINYSGSVYHTGGTCRMGPSNDTTAVVDSRLRVHGITGLRVIDASIMPSVPNGNTEPSIVMIGERGSAFIYEDYNVTNPSPAMLSEDNETPKYRADTQYHGSGGYLTVEISPYLTPLANAFVQAGIQMGYRNIDFNAANQTGFMIPEGTLRNGTRCSTAKAFLRPARNRPNLNVSYYSTVTRILIGEVNKTAYGVQFVRNGSNYQVLASKEVIVSAGVVNSPQLLLLSGVGPAQQLKNLNIPVYANLPVGQNLQDHAGVPMFFLVNQSVTEVRTVYESGESILNYAMEQSSPLSDPLATETIGFLNSPLAQPNLDFPDVEFLMCTSLPNHMNELQLFYIAAVFLHPESVGNITLASANPFDAPLINPAYFSAPSDFQANVYAAQMAYNLSQTPALQAYNSTFYLPFYPLCGNLTFGSTQFWNCLVKNYSATVFHPAGTCRMGPSNDTTAVVDPMLRVHNITGLRVIDASIMPKLVNGNTNAAIIMIGERGSAFIYQDYNVTNPSPAM